MRYQYSSALILLRFRQRSLSLIQREQLREIAELFPLGRPSRQRYARSGPTITFLRNHKDVISGMGFFAVPTVGFRLLYVWFGIDHGRRQILHFNGTMNSTAQWVIQQLRESFPGGSLWRYSIFDNDSIFSGEVSRSIRSLGITPKRTGYRSPWQNGTAERWAGSCRREILDHVIVFDENHLRRLLRGYVTYHNEERVHTRLRDAPVGRAVEA